MGRKCQFKDCDKYSSFGYENEKQAIYCKSHKLENMIDIVSKRCKTDNCNIRPHYNYQNEKQAIYCKSHKLDNMINIKDKKCQFENCNKQPIYNYENEKQAIYCKSHKLENMIDIKNKKCIDCIYTFANPKYVDICASCYFNKNPDDPRITNFKKREDAYMVPLKGKYRDIILDKSIDGGCSKRRPDGLIDILTHSIIIEIDEDQHIGKGYNCENKRMMLLFEDLGSRPLVMIRLNPDKYKIGNEIIKSSFTKTPKTGLLKKNEIEFNKRLDRLYEEIEYHIFNIPKKEINIIELFYNK